MAKRYQSIVALLPSLIAAGVIIVIIAFAMMALLLFAIDSSSWYDFIYDSYFWRLIGFTFFQAILSTILSVICAMILAKAVVAHEFRFKASLLRLYTMTFVLPSLVVISGILTVYAKNGWLNELMTMLHLDYSFSIYGLVGILLAHLFYNIPFATRLFVQSLTQIPTEQKQLAELLRFNYWQYIKWIEWPAMKPHILPLGGLIFLLCFSSFAVVLTLGGGPKYTTLEVAIYQAIRDFELGQAVTLAITQLLLCGGFVVLLQKYLPMPVLSLSNQSRNYMFSYSYPFRILHGLIIIISILLILPPLLSVVWQGITALSWKVIFNAALWQATLTSLAIALFTGIFTVILSTLLLWSARRERLFGNQSLYRWIITSGFLILAIPSMVFATGCFLLLWQVSQYAITLPLLVIITNTLMALPFSIKTLEQPMQEIEMRYHLLIQTLNIKSCHRLYWIEFKALKRVFALAFAFSCVLSMGDFGVVAIFGSENFITLPLYLYSQLGAYQNNAGDVTALLLLLLSFGLFTVIEKMGQHRD